MKTKTALTILILLTSGLFFRGWIYRKLVVYEPIDTRSTYTATDKNLIEYVETFSSREKDDITIEQVIRQSLSATSNRLAFAGTHTKNDPNQLIHSNTAHCVGYASFFTTTCNYLLDRYRLSDRWIAKAYKGQLHVLGVNIHNYVTSPFFKDHDFVIIENKISGERLAVDPSVHDYLRIDFVTLD